ncbi:hypothetical protein HYH02_010468 [Chlamydomonas schloesseri]|uniref:Non-specific serine/threonine protein kinase n=1 Tax=Chlamydomonas schloesseri TaxID=2026947 RepID=A0A835TLC3_9CHLO|nr:hypothetical protein HYH02_010468 [Chlamydomonas schloesseri]|eukprot:KAG2439835.1 hypothetical protein HYH02_010468 [Chlamydomonas schloesseri]
MGCNSSKPSYEAQDSGIHELANADDARKSEALKAEALRVADDMFALAKGRRFHENYTRLTLTSYGASCKVLTAFHRVTNKKVAVKTIPKSRKQLEKQRLKVKLEIGTFRLVEDHPNAVRVLEVFEGAECYYICMECCEGGELFDHISKKQASFTERQAAHLLRSLMLFLAHMHGKGIAHLDIKPENIMFDSEGANGVLKVLDFGSSVFVQPNETVRNAFGTVRYASPEMANDVCGQKADIWSAGVVMYILLSGRAPFLKGNDVDTLNLIKSSPRVKFAGDRWAGISQAAKDCIKALLEPNPRLRPSAVAVLNMPWLKQQAPETIIVPDTLRHLRAFANQSRIRRLLLGLMADQLVGSGANQLLGQFYTLDKDFSGTLEVSELVKAAKEAIPDLSEHEINRMFEALDVDRTGTVDIKEFFAGLIQTIDEEKQTLVAQKSFTMLDKRGAGFVTKEAFMEVLLERAQAGTLKTLAPKSEQGAGQGRRSADGGPASSLVPVTMHGRTSGVDGGEARVLLDPALVSELEQEFANLDANGDGVLSFEEFKAILGIQSTPEGLQLTQPQLPAVPSIAENMETLANTLRTRTRSHSALEEGTAAGRATSGATPGGGGHTHPSLGGLIGGRHRHSNSGGPSSTGALGASATSAQGGQRRHSSTGRDMLPPPPGSSAASGTGLPGGIASATSQGGAGGAKRRSHTGSGRQRLGGSGGVSPLTHGAGLQEGAEGEGEDDEEEGGGSGLPVGVLSGMVSVDRAAIDLEQPLDMETRDLLQLLAPAKRTPSSAAYGAIRGTSGGLGGGTAPERSGGCSGRTPSVRDIHSQAVAALLQRAASIGASRNSSVTAAANAVATLHKQPSMRHGSGHTPPHLGALPPLPSGASYHDNSEIAASARAALAAAEVSAAAGPVIEAELSEYYRAEPTTPAAVQLSASGAVSTSGIMSGPSAQGLLSGMGGSGAAVGYGTSPSQSPRSSLNKLRKAPPPQPPGSVPGPPSDAAAAGAAVALEAAADAAAHAHAPLLAGVTGSSEEDADGRLRLGSGGAAAGKLAARAPANGGGSSRGSSPSNGGAGL